MGVGGGYNLWKGKEDWVIVPLNVQNKGIKVIKNTLFSQRESKSGVV